MMAPVSPAGVPAAHPGPQAVPASALERTTPPTIAEVSSTAPREVLKCDHCKLVQFRSSANTCRRCKKSLVPEPPKLQPILAHLVEPGMCAKNEGLSVAAAVRDLRHNRNLSQRQLAARMNVPRTYISKIENGKAMPTLSSLDRLARALQVDISALLRDADPAQKSETAAILADPFLAEIAKFSAHLTPAQKSVFLNHVRELAQSATHMSGQQRFRRMA